MFRIAVHRVYREREGIAVEKAAMHNRARFSLRGSLLTHSSA